VGIKLLCGAARKDPLESPEPAVNAIHEVCDAVKAKPAPKAKELQTKGTRCEKGILLIK
jgi:hypothetical protein